MPGVFRIPGASVVWIRKRGVRLSFGRGPTLRAVSHFWAVASADLGSGGVSHRASPRFPPSIHGAGTDAPSSLFERKMRVVREWNSPSRAIHGHRPKKPPRGGWRRSASSTSRWAEAPVFRSRGSSPTQNGWGLDRDLMRRQGIRKSRWSRVNPRPLSRREGTSAT